MDYRREVKVTLKSLAAETPGTLDIIISIVLTTSENHKPRNWLWTTDCA
jgi:hypothetical protein